MAKLSLPPGWPDPFTLLRDPKWEENYPKILLRGIHGVMIRAKGDDEQRYKAGFNIIVYRMTLVAHPPRFFPNMIKKGILNMDVLTLIGKEREAEVLGLRSLSPKSIRKYGKKSRSHMKNSTRDKMIELRKMFDMVRATTPEEMPPAQSPVS